MKLFVLLTLCAFVAAAPKQKETPIIVNEIASDAGVDYYKPSYLGYRRHSLGPNQPPGSPTLPTTPDALLRLLRNFVDDVIANGYPLFGIPPLEPLRLDNFEFSVPAELINMDLKLKGVFATGFGNFIVHKSDININELSFDIDVEFPVLDIKADEYDMVGDLFTAIPLYGKGRAHFYVEGFRFQAKLFLKQSDNGRSVIIDRVENAAYRIPHLKSNLTGAIGGGDVDAIVNVMIEQVIMGYVNRFHGAIAIITSRLSVTYGNPFLDQLDSWRYIAALLPGPRE